MAQSPYKSHAVIVLPPGRNGGVVRRGHRKWLSRGRIQSADVPEEMLAGVLRTVGHAAPAEGLAALRFWGQTSERSGAWMAAADPVYLEARLNHLRVYALRDDEIPRPHLRELFDYLQQMLGGDERYAFARLGQFAYLRGQAPIATAAVSPNAIDDREPDEYMPQGDHAATHDQLLSELQMALHDHEVNQQRAASGMRPVNSIWIWGGGTAPQQDVRPIPPLFAVDPLFRGYWDSCTGVIGSWTGNVDDALSTAPDGFVAVVPDEIVQSHPQAMTDCLEDLRLVVKRGDLRKLTLLFHDGLRIDIGRADALRFWRNVSPLLMAADDHE